MSECTSSLLTDVLHRDVYYRRPGLDHKEPTLHVGGTIHLKNVTTLYQKLKKIFQQKIFSVYRFFSGTLSFIVREESFKQLGTKCPYYLRGGRTEVVGFVSEFFFLCVLVGLRVHLSTEKLVF